MTEHNFRNSKLTRVMTTACTCVLLAVSVYSFIFGVGKAVFPENQTVNTGVTQRKTIIIDAGHGGEDGGTQSESGILEKHINLEISTALNDIFSFFGYNTVMTRSEDRLSYGNECDTMRKKKVSDIHNRMRIMENNPDSLFLSIHQNHYEGKSSWGTQVFYSDNNKKSEKIAESIQKTVASDIQKENKRMIKKSGKEIYLLHNTKNPAVMVECGFLSNPEEAEKLNNADYQKLMAFEIFKGTVMAGG